MRERVSVIIPVYNGERFLAEALQSVLDQTLPPDEIIVVDDGSTDGTAAITRSMGARVCYYRQANQGPAAARNLGLEYAHGEIIAFQDADDVWAPGRLVMQLGLLAQHPYAQAVIGRTCFFCTVAAPVELTALDNTKMAPRWFLGMHSGLYRRSAFESVGRFNANLRYHEDIDWFRRARAQGLVVYPHEDIVLLHRRHANNTTNDRPALRQELLRMLRQSPQGHVMSEQSLLAWITDGIGNQCDKEKIHVHA